MAQSVRNIVDLLNLSLEGVFKQSKLYGVAVSVERDGKMFPSVNESPATFDDDFSLIIYHKINSLKVSSKPGFGDNDIVINEFSLSAFVFNNEKITGLKSDEVAMILQSYFDTSNISLQSVILNTQNIYSSEYRGSTFLLPEYMSLMQINYTVEMTFKSGCVSLCPEDFTSCKN